MNTSKNDNTEITEPAIPAPSYEHLPQVNKELRGHEFYPQVPIPALYETEDIDAKNKVIHAKYFHPGGVWLVAEVDPSNGLAFGFVKLASAPESAEWGYFELTELEEVRTHGGYRVIERDCNFTPRKFWEMSMI